MSRIDKYLEDRRNRIDKLTPEQVHEKLAQNDGTVIIDIRPSLNRNAEGCIPGSLIVDRNVLEWRLDRTSPHCIYEAKKDTFAPVIMCNEGYASALAVHTLNSLGVRAKNLERGYRGWKEDGLPTGPQSPTQDRTSIGGGSQAKA